MPNDYEKSTRTELHKMQTKFNEKRRKERLENLTVGGLMTLGVLLSNLLAPVIMSSPKCFIKLDSSFGMADFVFMSIGIYLILKGLRK
jgi:hypothetical protein